MSAKTATISLPKSIGGSNLADCFGKINLSPEVKEFLDALNAKLTVSYDGTGKPEFSILDKRGDPVCSFTEFVKLGGFRRWVTDELKAQERELASDEKVKLVALFFRKAKEEKYALSERMEEANETKFRQFHSMVKIINDHLERIEDTISSDARTYLLEKGGTLVKVIYKQMLGCLRPEKVEKEKFEKDLLECAVPKWLYNKLVDKSFTGNLKADATSLLFPKGNYLKSIALTSKECLNEAFLAGNNYVVKNSGAIVALAKYDWINSGLIPSAPTESAKDIASFVEGFTWAMNSPYTISEVLELRASGKAPPSFKARQKPNPKPGSKARPETETQRICREIYNTLGVVNSVFLHISNAIIPVADPLEGFWSRIIADTDAWEITPSHGLYACVIESKEDVSFLRDFSKPFVLKMINEVICHELSLSMATQAAKNLRAFIMGLDNSVNSPATKPQDIDYAIYSVDISTMEAVEIPGQVLEDTKKFLGVSSSRKEKKEKRAVGSAVRLHTSVLNELEAIRALPKVYEHAKEWISNSFKTGKRVQTQLIAAERIVGEVLRNQGQLLGEDFDEFRILEDIEDYEEDD
jgi:hypothetical protein